MYYSPLCLPVYPRPVQAGEGAFSPEELARQSLRYWLHRWAVGDRYFVGFGINSSLDALGGFAGTW